MVGCENKHDMIHLSCTSLSPRQPPPPAPHSLPVFLPKDVYHALGPVSVSHSSASRSSKRVVDRLDFPVGPLVGKEFKPMPRSTVLPADFLAHFTYRLMHSSGYSLFRGNVLDVVLTCSDTGHKSLMPGVRDLY